MILVEYFSGRDSNFSLVKHKMYIDVSKIQYIKVDSFDWIGSTFVTIGINGEKIALTDESGCDLVTQMGLSIKDIE